MWTYKIIVAQLTEDELNTLGADGWELVCISGNSFFFKKPAA